MTTPAELSEAFQNLYGGEPQIYRAPGRVNLIGEHTDYNGGFVMPVAIDLSTWVAIRPRNDRKLSIRSENFSETKALDLDGLPTRGQGHWSDYPFGVAVKLLQAGHRLRAANLLVRGEVPLGSGLSSSAAIEVATGYALLDQSDIRVDRLELALMCQRAENEFVGTRCGLMDQFVSCFGEAGHALMLDCRSLDYKLLALPTNLKLVVCNTMVKHELASSEYNLRRAECEEGVRLLAHERRDIQSLRDVSVDDLEQFGASLPALIYKRCRHVVTENRRVNEAALALQSSDMTAFGRLMAQSHASLRDDYEVSCAELDLMVQLANETGSCLGARMTGGGFGGCTINLVESNKVDSFVQRVSAGYERATRRTPDVYVCSTAQGAQKANSKQ